MTFKGSLEINSAVKIKLERKREKALRINNKNVIPILVATIRVHDFRRTAR